jgi:peptide/nickel transport system permease protein
MEQTEWKKMDWQINPALAPVPGKGSKSISLFIEGGPAIMSMLLILLVIMVSSMAPVFTPYGRDSIDLDNILSSPSPAHLLGTDELGRDTFTRLIYGGRFTLMVGFFSVFVAVLIGIVLGSVSGYFGGSADHIVTSVIELFLSVPVFPVVLLAAAVWGNSLWVIPVIIGVTSWMEIARLVRTRVRSLRVEAFVDAARTLGTGNISLMARHLVPGTIGIVVAAATVGFARAMLIESALSFLGFGIQPPIPTWGNMLQNAGHFMRESQLAVFIPGFMILITCLCFNYLGEGLRRALDKRS